MTYAASRRTREIGIRVALGAKRWGILWLVLKEAAVPVLAGVLIGIPIAHALTRLITSLLYGISPGHPVSLALGASVLVTVALVAAWIPARRASRVDPLAALRYE